MSAEMVRELATLRVAEAEAFFCICVHRDARGYAIPTITAITPGLADVHAKAMQERLQGIADVLRAAYAPKASA